MYYYRIYGLIIKCEIELPEANVFPDTTDYDVSVHLGKVSMAGEQHPNYVRIGPSEWYCIAKKNHMLFGNGNFIFEVYDGKKIVAQIQNLPCDLSKLRTYLLGTAFGALNMQLGHIPIHGAAIKRKDSALIICGHCGAGKSTIADLFIEGGHQYLSDDVSTADVINGTAIIYPAYPQRKLCEDAALDQHHCVRDFETVIEDYKKKYLIRRHTEWHCEPLPMGAIVEVLPVTSHDRKQLQPKLLPIKGREALTIILRNLYRKMFYQTHGIEPAQMKKLLVIANTIGVYQLSRPEYGYKNECLKEIMKYL